jgi:hypothetical protein
MNRKCLSLITIVAMMLGASSAFARGARGAHSLTQSSDSHMEKLKEALAQLNLSGGQKTQIKQIMTEAKTSATSQKATAGASTAKGHGHPLLRKIMKVLTEPQKTKLMQILKSERSGRK